MLAGNSWTGEKGYGNRDYYALPNKDVLLHWTGIQIPSYLSDEEIRNKVNVAIEQTKGRHDVLRARWKEFWDALDFLGRVQRALVAAEGISALSS